MPLSCAQVNFTGGTGEVIFDANGDRLGFAGAIYNYKPITNMPSDPNEVRAEAILSCGHCHQASWWRFSTVVT